MRFENLQWRYWWYRKENYRVLECVLNTCAFTLVDSHKQPCGTVLESAKIHHGMLTGLVATSRITHATPAAFSAHVASRNQENEIAEQQIGYNPLGRTVDLMFGGGVCEFLPNITKSSCRQDNRDLFFEAKEQFGWTVKLSRDEFDAFNPNNASLPLMALFASSVI